MVSMRDSFCLQSLGRTVLGSLRYSCCTKVFEVFHHRAADSLSFHNKLSSHWQLICLDTCCPLNEYRRTCWTDDSGTHISLNQKTEHDIKPERGRDSCVKIRVVLCPSFYEFSLSLLLSGQQEICFVLLYLWSVYLFCPEIALDECWFAITFKKLSYSLE